jgi:hypothetical protein
VRRLGLRYLRHRPGAPLSNFTGAPFELVPGQEFAVPPGGIVLGRSATAGVRVMSGIVARQHVRVWPAPDGLALETLKGTNTTEVNGVALEDGPRVEGAAANVYTATLRLGDRLTLAEAFEFEVIELGDASPGGA